jgi:hypothetical protein
MDRDKSKMDMWDILRLIVCSGRKDIFVTVLAFLVPLL